MGRTRHIDHRRPPKEAGQPKVIRDGQTVDYSPEPINPNDPLVKAKKEMEVLRNRLSVAEQTTKVKEAESSTLKDMVRNARDESQHLRKQLEEQKDEGVQVKRIEIITVEDIERSGDIAQLAAVCQIDGHVEETTIVLPVSIIKRIIKEKKSSGRNQRTESVPEVRGDHENSVVSDEPTKSAQSG